MVKFQYSANLLLLLAVGTLFSVSPQTAAIAQTIPTQDSPSRIDQDITIPTPPSDQPDLTIPESTDLTPPAGAETQIFRLSDLNIEGITVYSAEELEPFYSDYLNQDISLLTLYDIANQITQQYRADGYLLTQAFVPAQTIQSGMAQIQILEGYIQSVNYEGAPEKQLQRLTGFGEKIQASMPLQQKDLERYLLLAGDLAGFEVRGVLGKGSEPGASELTLVVTQDPVDGFVSFNNRGTDSVGELRLQSGVFLNSLLGQGERFSLSGATTPTDLEELANIAGALTFPIGSEGLAIDLGSSYTAIRPGDDLRQFDINGNATAFNLGVSYPIRRSRQSNLAVTGRFDTLNESITTNFTGAETFISEDRLRVLRLGLNSDFGDRRGVTYAGAALSLGLDAFGARDSGSATRPVSRANGSADFTKLNLNLSRQQFLPNGFGVNLAAIAQITDGGLFSSEQFGLGGSNFGRAFDSSEVLGDSGYGLRAEVQKTYFYGDQPKFTQPYGFIDYGQVFRTAVTAVEPGQSSLGSIGIGVRQHLVRDMLFQLELAVPIVEDNLFSDQGTRLFFNVEGFF